MVHVDAMIYYTQDFKSIVTDPIVYIEELIKESNHVFENSEVAMKLRLHCVEEVEMRETPTDDRNEEFLIAKCNATKEDELSLCTVSMLNSADIAIVMTATTIYSQSGTLIGGQAAIGPAPTMRQPPLAWVAAGIQQVFPLWRVTQADFVELFVHEVAHLFGCLHDRAEEGGGSVNETSYGYIVEGKYRTTMVHSTSNEAWIPYFSSKDISYDGIPIGDAESDNSRTLRENRFLMSMIGDQTGNCSTNIMSCAGRCLRGNSVPANLTLRDREIWCRSNCNMPSSGYFNLLGEPVGLGYGPWIGWIVFYVIPIVATIMATGCVVKTVFWCISEKKKYSELRAKIAVSPSTKASILAVAGMLIDGAFLVVTLMLHGPRDYVGVTAWLLAGVVDGGLLYAVRDV